jgi:hypothetical protein
MQKHWIALMVLVFVLGTLAGFGMSYTTGIQPGYFEKQEAPAYGVAADKALGSDLGKAYEEHFKNLYKSD